MKAFDKHPLKLLDSRKDILFWIMLKEDMVDPSRASSQALPSFYLNGFVPAGMQWLIEAIDMDFHDGMRVSDLISLMGALCHEQIKRSQSGNQLTLNHLIYDLAKDAEEEAAFDRLFAALTPYPSFGLFLADVDGAYLLPQPGIEALKSLPSPSNKIRFEVHHVIQEWQEKEFSGQDDPLVKLSWVDINHLRGGACTLEGGFDVVMQIFEESKQIFLNGESAEFRSKGCMVTANGHALFKVSFPSSERDQHRRSLWRAPNPEANILWEAQSDLYDLLGGQTLMAWVYQQYEARGMTLNIEAALGHDLGL